MASIPPQYRATVDQIAQSAAEWVARDLERTHKLLTCLIESDASFIENLAAGDADLVRSLLIIAIFEALEKSERAEDPEDVLYLSVDERCDLERLMAVIGEVKNAGVTDEQASKIDAVVGTLAHILRI